MRSADDRPKFLLHSIAQPAYSRPRMNSSVFKIAALAGDGIGQEVMPQALNILNIISEKFGHTFVIQTGDPRGDQNGGPGYSIRCEINEVPYDRGAVGMALSGKDTGGSQWFVTHSPQPHLDGGYTVFGRVIRGMDVVDRIARGDIIRRVIVNEKN